MASSSITPTAHDATDRANGRRLGYADRPEDRQILEAPTAKEHNTMLCRVGFAVGYAAGLA